MALSEDVFSTVAQMIDAREATLQGERDTALTAAAAYLETLSSTQATLATTQKSLEAALARIKELEQPADPGDLSGWGLPSWRDEFDGPLDTTVWIARDGYRDAKSLDGYNAASQVSVVDGFLRLRAEKLATPKTVNGVSCTYVGGYVYTRGKKALGYGRTDIRVKMLTPGSSTGMWSGPWFRDVNLGGEIDLAEAIGTPSRQKKVYPDDGSGVQQTVYFQTGDKTKPYSQKNLFLPAPIDGFHLYSLEQTPTRIVMLIDGKETYRTEDPKILAGFSGQLDIRISQFIGEAWGSRVGATTGPVNDVLVDYVRHWDLPA